jgi:hypothetical protein
LPHAQGAIENSLVRTVHSKISSQLWKKMDAAQKQVANLQRKLSQIFSGFFGFCLRRMYLSKSEQTRFGGALRGKAGITMEYGLLKN